MSTAGFGDNRSEVLKFNIKLAATATIATSMILAYYLSNKHIFLALIRLAYFFSVKYSLPLYYYAKKTWAQISYH